MEKQKLWSDQTLRSRVLNKLNKERTTHHYSISFSSVMEIHSIQHRSHWCAFNSMDGASQYSHEISVVSFNNMELSDEIPLHTTLSSLFSSMCLCFHCISIQRKSSSLFLCLYSIFLGSFVRYMSFVQGLFTRRHTNLAVLYQLILLLNVQSAQWFFVSMA